MAINSIQNNTIDDDYEALKAFVVNKDFTKSSHNYIQVYRDGLIEDGILEPSGSSDSPTYRFTKNHTFNSPSLAAGVNSNGWIEWKYPDGKTLDEVKRKNS